MRFERFNSRDLCLEVLKPEQNLIEIDGSVLLCQFLFAHLQRASHEGACSPSFQSFTQPQVVPLKSIKPFINVPFPVNRHPSSPRYSMKTHEDQNQPQYADIDDLLLQLDHQLIDLRDAIERRYDRESLSEVLRALLAAQSTLNDACLSVSSAVTSHARP